MCDEQKSKEVINIIREYDIYLAGLCLGEHKGIHSEFGELIDDLLKNIGKEESRKTLVKIAGRELIDRFINILNEEDNTSRKYVCEILGEIGSEKAIEPLVKLLEDKDADVRRSAVYALSKIFKNLNREGQDSLVARIMSLKIDNKTESINHIKETTGRRFIRLLKASHTGNRKQPVG